MNTLFRCRARGLWGMLVPVGDATVAVSADGFAIVDADMAQRLRQNAALWTCVRPQPQVPAAAEAVPQHVAAPQAEVVQANEVEPAADAESDSGDEAEADDNEAQTRGRKRRKPKNILGL